MLSEVVQCKCLSHVCRLQQNSFTTGHFSSFHIFKHVLSVHDIQMFVCAVSLVQNGLTDWFYCNSCEMASIYSNRF